ncbi:MAG TPA: L-histidine N(alpha)-methyltransferase, partial [Terriglobales bacterium]
NRELVANFDLASFRHVAVWNPAASRMEIYLESMRAQSVSISMPKSSFKFKEGERIHTENSYKYTLEMVARMLCVSGFRLQKTWFDKREWFGLHLAQANS